MHAGMLIIFAWTHQGSVNTQAGVEAIESNINKVSERHIERASALMNASPTYQEHHNHFGEQRKP
jgi:hypothetical protein